MATETAAAEQEPQGTTGQHPQAGQQPAQDTGQQAGQGDTGSTLLGNTPTPQTGQGETQDNQGTGVQSTQSTGQGEATSPILEMIGDEELKQDPSLQQIQSVEDLAKGYVHAQKLVGKDKLVLPKDENDTDAWNDVLKKLGRPGNADDYELPQLADDSPVELPEGTDQWFKNKAHELGLTQKQARDLWGSYLSEVAEKSVQDQTQAAEQAKQQATDQLKKEFGNAFDEKLQDARVALKQYDPEGEVTKALEQTGAGNNPALIKMLSQIGEQFREDKVGGSSKNFSRTPDQAQQEIQDLKADKSFMEAWMDNTNPGHQSAVAKMTALYKEAYPNG